MDNSSTAKVISRIRTHWLQREKNKNIPSVPCPKCGACFWQDGEYRSEFRCFICGARISTENRTTESGTLIPP